MQGEHNGMNKGSVGGTPGAGELNGERQRTGVTSDNKLDSWIPLRISEIVRFVLLHSTVRSHDCLATKNNFELLGKNVKL